MDISSELSVQVAVFEQFQASTHQEKIAEKSKFVSACWTFNNDVRSCALVSAASRMNQMQPRESVGIAG